MDETFPLIAVGMTLYWPENLEPFLRERVCATFKHPEDVLLQTDRELARSLGISITSARLVLSTIAGMFAPTPMSALNLYESRDVLSVGLPSLDTALGGGLRKNWLVEIVGEAGSGKTQWALTIASQLLLKKGTVYWIDTENTFRPDRMLQMLHGDQESLSSLLVRRCHSLSELLDSFTELCSIVNADDTGVSTLIVLDSLAAVARVHASPAIDRTEVIHRLARLAKRTSAVTVVTNHVSTEMKTSKPDLRATLGNTWAHDVTCRFWLNMQQNPFRQRCLTVSKAPNIDNSIPFMLHVRIESNGIQETGMN